MSWLLALSVGALLAAGVFLLLSRQLLRLVLGVSLVGSGVNLLLFAAGRIGPTAPPVVELGEQVLTGAANPVPQALVLTAIVIGFALVCFSLILALAVQQAGGDADVDSLRDAEPPPGADGKPALEVER